MSSPPPQPASKRRVPPPCWTREETLALIDAYREKWFGLGRGNLRASDWDNVAAAVSSASDSGTKSSVQCRHKIEKLRKRYRGEKQRSLRCPGKFFSSWDLFPLLDSMNFASSSATGSGDQDHAVDHEIAPDGIRLKSKNQGRGDGVPGSNLSFEDDYGGGYVSKFANFKGNFDSDNELGGGYGVKLMSNRDLGAQDMIFRGNGRIVDGYGSIVDIDRSAGGFPVRSVVPAGVKSKNYSKQNVNFSSNFDYAYGIEEYMIDEGAGFQAKVSTDWDSIPPGIPLKRKSVGIDGSLDPNADFEFLNGFVSSSRLRFGRKKGDGGAKMGLDPVEEMVSSIKVLAEGFVKMERMKMEMVKEIEKMRMEMEMKHNQMILESQQQIVDAFAKALLEKKKKKAKLLSPDANSNGDEAE
ncbi:hypothetical protein SLEP1_g8980 [Rubroshorea leprosula]|uniref:Myb-like domain-containing protein n=1 Tax=Rubroshorea leprosula TaxID=152421 RepID=A0AAV5I3H7_9ROSI|nr:hypothetical protein SLEP1_g8980 [Rubroshorea leprosula]